MHRVLPAIERTALRKHAAKRGGAARIYSIRLSASSCSELGTARPRGCGGLEIDDKLVSERELNRQIAWARAPQYPVNVGRCRPHQLELVDPIGH
jgi:hypothetical protein